MTPGTGAGQTGRAFDQETKKPIKTLEAGRLDEKGLTGALGRTLSSLQPPASSLQPPASSLQPLSLAERFDGQTREIGDQAVDAEIGQTPHQRGFVYRPYRYVQTLCLGLGDALGCAQRPLQRQQLAVVLPGYLERIEPGVFGNQA